VRLVMSVTNNNNDNESTSDVKGDFEGRPGRPDTRTRDAEAPDNMDTPPPVPSTPDNG